MSYPKVSLGAAGVRVIDCDHRTPQTSSEGKPYVTIPEMKGGRLNLDVARRISETDFVEWTRKARPQRHDVVLSRRCNPGDTAYVEEDGAFALGQNLVLLRSSGEVIYPPILRFLVQGAEWWDEIGRYLNVGAVFDSLRIPDILKMEVRVPPLKIQVAIATLLGNLDDKIEVNRQMNQTLEEMARAIFRSWFVDFDPVRVKAAGGDPVKELGLSPEIAALFPDSFRESELGDVPLGWSVGSILGVARLLSGGTPKTARADYWDGEVKWASAKDVSQCKSAFLIETERTITEAGLAGSATRLIPAYSTVVVARGATTGRMVMFGREMAMNQTCYALQSLGGTPFALNMLCREIMPSLVSAAHGSVFDTITTKTFENSRVVTPPQAVLTAFESLVVPLFHLVLATEVENAHLSDLRDYLLPLLLSGKAEINSRFEQDCPPKSSSDSLALSGSSCSS